MIYLAFIYYVINIVYAFEYHGIGTAFINLFIPYSYMWDTMIN